MWLGAFRGTGPVSDQWGFDRGTPVDRRYIEAFLDHNRDAITGRALEIQDRTYCTRFGTDLVQSDILDIDPGNSRATLIADLADAGHVASNSYDCAIVTQTLHLIPDTRAAIRHLHRVLAPGGTLLATLPAVSRISRSVGVDGDYWRFTVASARWLLGDVFSDAEMIVGSRGNVLGAIAFLAGLAAEELDPADLDADDPLFPVVITVRATKHAGG
jgi:SAM-dependent methyltransferase